VIGWSEVDESVREAVRDFIAKEITPHLDELESGAMPPYDIIRKLFSSFGLDAMATEAIEGMLKADRRRLTEPAEPREKRDRSTSPLSDAASMGAVLVSELAGVSLGTIASLGVSLGLTAATIASEGSLEQKERWLPKLATFEHIGAWAITEPDSGSDAFGGMSTTVRRDGDDYILNGQKTFITNGPDADVIVVYAKLDEGDGLDKRQRPVLAFVLEKGMPGLIQGKAFKKMGMMSSPTGELAFQDVRLTSDRLLGGNKTKAVANGAKDKVRSSFAAERMGVAFMSLGIIEQCLRLSVEYAKSRTLWGKPISEFQLIQLKLARMEVARINVQNMVFSSLEQVRKGRMPSLTEASAMKLYSSEVATEVAMDAVQLFGGNGYMAEFRVEQLARDAKSLMIYAGSNEVQITHVARGLLAETSSVRH